MRKTCLIITMLLILTTLLLPGCTISTEYVTLTDSTTTKTLPVISITQTTTEDEITVINEEKVLEQVKGTDEGVIDLEGAGRFYYQSIENFSNGLVFQGVTFTSYVDYLLSQGTTLTGPVNYWLLVEFEDGTIEDLQNVGLLSDGIDINLTEHENPQAGVMMVAYTEVGAIGADVYLLVSLAE